MNERLDASSKMPGDQRLKDGAVWKNTQTGEAWSVVGQTPEGNVILRHTLGGEITRSKKILGIDLDEHESDTREITEGFASGKSIWEFMPEKKTQES